MTASKLIPRKKKWGPRDFKIISDQLNVPRCQIGYCVSVDIFLVFLSVFFFNDIVTGLNVSEFNQMYEILG